MRVRYQAGFTYPIAMFAVAVSAILSLHAMENALTNARREQETALLETGEAFRAAIRMYYEQSPGSVKGYPPDLDALLEDDRSAILRRHLRRIYRDPVTGSEQWGLLKNEDGSIKGVHSLSTRAPDKKGGFLSHQLGFDKALTYQDWHFVYSPTT